MVAFTPSRNDGGNVLQISRFLLIKEQKQPKQVQICHLEKSSKSDLLNICVIFLE